MRAVARGLFLETLPACPERCGGPGARLEQLTDQQRQHRERHGCDKDIPDGERCWYAIRCPRCHGASCDLCGEGDYPGHLVMRRCPASHMSSDIAEAIGALTWLKDGILPDGVSLGDQSISFVEFRRLFETEKNEVLEEQRKEG